MKIVIEKDKNYDHLLSQKFISGNFLQSSIWIEFLKRQNKNFWPIAVESENKILALCLFYETSLPMGLSYLTSPKGPIFLTETSEKDKKEISKLLLSKARDICISTKKKDEIFCRLEPNAEIKISGLKKSKDIHPRDTWILNLDKEEKDLLAGMHPKTRYNIAVAKKNGVQIKFSQEKEDIKHFLNLIKLTATRNQISVHSDNYYTLLWDTLLGNRAGSLALAEYRGELVAANLLINFGQSCVYLHGGSNYKYRNLMAPSLLQWESIKQAKAAGFLVYDFWGIAPQDNSQARWEGITRFKKGFGGERLVSPGAYDYIYHPTWYQIYHLGRKTISKLRKFR